ncbi:ArsC family reductase [Marinobacter sp.]|uniref:ArsC family reductase n=1 Tax=Marinobacter sp. TaxID=50741 RepID=UPI001B6F7D06|nr:ArsC family reductase [Marinobacter sp.]MBQ0834105.1 ArsC family reductase [Marinobacter sp.]
MKLYGIRNCDTVKKARKWLDEQDISYEFHDFKKDGIDEARLTQWEKAVSWEALLNRRGTTWRNLGDDVRDSINGQSAHDIMLKNTSIIKRPVVEHEGSVYVGFNADDWATLFK